jgi:hypothetical protein
LKKDEVPQDLNAAFAGERKAVYALDESGQYATAPSSGWTVEEIVTGQAVEEYRRLALEAWQRARAGTGSPLEYHMCARRMEVPTLAEAAGVWKWRLRRHLRPAIFASLPPVLLRRYAEALGLSAEQLKQLPEEPR